MTTFALLHGAWHGAWCWELLTPELQRRGHGVVAVDLPIDDPDATFEDYADVAASALADTGDDVVAVGHSLSGNVLPWLAERRPVRHLVYLGALVADLGRSVDDQQRNDGMLNLLYLTALERVGGCTRWADADLARSLLYADCDDEVVLAALARVRPQATLPIGQLCTLARQPTVPSTYIVCAEDQVVHPAWSRRVARERLGASLVELPGSHSPFYSRPAELAEVLDGLG